MNANVNLVPMKLRISSKRDSISLFLKKAVAGGALIASACLSGCSIIYAPDDSPDRLSSSVLNFLFSDVPRIPAGTFGGLAYGDFDCDGREDLALGDPDQSIDGVPRVGVVHVHYGSGEQEVIAATQIEATANGETDGFGFALAAGNFDNSSCDDLAIGAPGYDGNATDVGRVYIVRGYANGGLYPDASNNEILDGPQNGGFFGTALATGHFNDDRLADLAVGTPMADPVEFIIESRGGAVWIFHGTSTGVASYALFSQATDNSFGMVKGEVGDDDLFGFSLAAGDFDGNGFDDLAIGVVGEDKAAGVVNVLYSADDGRGLTAVSDQIWSQDSTGVKGRKQEFDGFGFALAAGDFDCTGYQDLAIGVPNEDIRSNGIYSAGVVNVLYGSPKGLTAKKGSGIRDDQLWYQADIAGKPSEYDYFGAALATGKLNGDRCDDLVISVPRHEINGHIAGAVNILPGSATGLVAEGSQFLSQASPGVNAEDPQNYDYFGMALAIGNFDGDPDGIDELAVRVNDGAACAAHVFYGPLPGPVDGDELIQCTDDDLSQWTSGFTITDSNDTVTETDSGDSGVLVFSISGSTQVVQ